MYVTKGNYKPVEGDIQKKDNRTEQAGYIPPKIQIEGMIRAGINLDQYRKEMYDFSPEDKVPEDQEPVTVRDPNYDLADAFQNNEAIKARTIDNSIAEEIDLEKNAEEKEKAKEANKEDPDNTGQKDKGDTKGEKKA